MLSHGAGGTAGNLAWLGTALAFSLWMFMLERLTPSAAGIASLLAPVVGVTASALQLHEHPSVTELTGMTLIVAALVLNSLPYAQRASPSPA